MVKALLALLTRIRGACWRAFFHLPPGRYVAKVREVKVDPETRKVTIIYDNVKPDTSPENPRRPLRRVRKEIP